LVTRFWSALASPRVVVLTPAYNESRNIVGMIHGVGSQTVRAEGVLICDNGSTDGTATTAAEACRREGLSCRVIALPRIASLGKLNINRAYRALAEGLAATRPRPDFVATIEADVIMEPTYFEEILKGFSADPLLGVAGGALEPLGLLQGGFPLGRGGVMVWGANRVYSYRCWEELTSMVDLRDLPAWDTDHAVLAAIRGYHVRADGDAISRASRSVSTSRGRPKGEADAAHGLPVWWALFKATQLRDPSYLIKYGVSRLSTRNSELNKANVWLKALGDVYNRAAVQVLRSTLEGGRS